MEERGTAELLGPLGLLPPVEFCCAYGAALLPNNDDKTSMVDYILGVQDPIQWHSEVAGVADRIGVGVHFNPFVEWRDKMIKYGVVRMHDLSMDVLSWNRFYLSGRLQKPVRILIDNWEIGKVNLVNLKAATSAALLLLPAEFTEEDLYAKICSLSYMGDLRMLFAEDRNKVKKIVQGSFTSFRSMYKPLLREYESEGLLRFPSNSNFDRFKQDCGSSAASYHFSSLPRIVQCKMGGNHNSSEAVTPQISISSRGEAANCVKKVLRRLVMVSSTRQAVSGALAAGGFTAARYLAKKITKAWKSRTS